MYGRIPYLNNSWSSWAIHRFYLRRLSYYKFEHVLAQTSNCALTVSILVSIVEYSCNHHHLLMTAWVSCVCLAKNVVVRVLISYVVQWEESADIHFEMKLISSCFYISYFMDFTSACIQTPGNLPLTSFANLCLDYALYKYKYPIIISLFPRLV